jgi:hypothetical protein
MGSSDPASWVEQSSRRKAISRLLERSARPSHCLSDGFFVCLDDLTLRFDLARRQVHMLKNPPRTSHLQGSERPWKPVLLAGATEPTDAMWFEGVLATAAEVIGVVLLAVLGGLIYLFNHFVFKSRAVRRDDVHDEGKKGKEE